MTVTREILDEAVAWHVRLNAGDAGAADFRSFTMWLESDERHRAAFDRIEALDGVLSEPTLDAPPAPIGVLRPRSVERRGTHRGVLAAAIVLATALAAGLLFLPQSTPSGVAVYMTRVGETRSVVLADGSAVELDGGTRLLVSASRRVRLDYGEATFRVRPNASRPFAVEAGDRGIRDIGTVFDVRRNDAGTMVVVAEGMVVVTSRSGAEIQLRRGDKLAYRDGEPTSALARTDPSRALAWQSGYLIYDNAPLSEVVSDLNRHFAGRIVLGNAAMGALRFSGVLRMDRETAVLDRIALFLPVRITRTSDGGFVLNATPKSD